MRFGSFKGSAETQLYWFQYVDFRFPKNRGTGQALSKRKWVNCRERRGAKTLTVGLHHLTQAAHDDAIRHLCEQLNATETIFPDTELKFVYQLGTSQIP